jgi:hypothetical protein
MGSSLVFRQPENWEYYMGQRHFYKARDKVIIVDPEGLNVQPSSLECRAMYTLKDASGFAEFRLPCTSVSVSRTSETISGFKFMTTQDTMCTIVVAFGEDDLNNTLSISRLRPATIRAADRWRCVSAGSIGTACNETHPFEMFTAEIVNSTIETIVTYNSNSDMDGSVSDAANLEVLDSSDIIAMVTIILGSLVGGIIIVIIIIIVVKKYRRYRERRALARAIGQAVAETRPPDIV